MPQSERYSNIQPGQLELCPSMSATSTQGHSKASQDLATIAVNTVLHIMPLAEMGLTVDRLFLMGDL